MGDEERPRRPLLLPETYSGESNFDDWISHFETVASINEWDDAAKLKWLSVRLSGRAQTAFRRFSEVARGTYAAARKALLERFEPPAKKDVYAAEFQCRRKDKAEGWGDFADSLKTLVEKAFPNLEPAAKETLALNHYLTQIDNQQVAFGVKQRRPASLVEAVSYTIEMESYLQRPAKLAPVTTEEPPLVNTIQNQQGVMVKALEEVTQRLQKLEATMQDLSQAQTKRSPSQNRGQRNRNQDQPVVCHRCKQEGHYARGCAYRGTPSGN